MDRVTNHTSLQKDMLASTIRLQIVELKNVLESVEQSRQYEEDYVKESLKTVGFQLNRLRRFLDE